MNKPERGSRGISRLSRPSDSAEPAGNDASLNCPSDPSDNPKTVREKAKAMYREAVLKAAEQVFTEDGIRGARMRDIAKQAGVSVGTVYNHFSQKEEIVTALVAEHERQCYRAFAAQPGDPEDFVGAMRARHGRLIELTAQHVGFYSLAINDGFLDPHRDVTSVPVSVTGESMRNRFGNAAVELFEQGIREGIVRNLDPIRLEYFYVAAVKGVIVLAINDPKTNLTEEGNVVLDLFLRAIGVDIP